MVMAGSQPSKSAGVEETTSSLTKLELSDEDWEREQGIPQFSDPFIQKYFSGRDALIVQEDKHRSDGDFRQMLSPMAKEASAIVGQIRFEEQQTVWKAEVDDELARDYQGEVYPGMMFTLAKKRMESTKTWQIVKKMPKGALLHCHFEAMIDQDWLFREALNTKGLCIWSNGSLESPKGRDNHDIIFGFRSQSKASGPSIWTNDYREHSAVPLAEAADSFPDKGREGFIQWLQSRCSISPEESISHHQGPCQIWSKFISCFGILRSLVYYEPIYRKALSRMFHQLAEDGIRYVDLRAAMHFDFHSEGSEKPLEQEEGRLDAIRILGEELEKFQATEQGKDFWGARMIWTSIRSFDNRTICESMEDCITAKLTYPDIIAGFDLVGHEDAGRSLADLTPLLFWFRKACAQAGVNIPFFFHAGETLGSGSEADTNLFDAITLGTRRIGHGFSLYKHPLLMNMVRDRRICVEVCPISNEVLRLTSSISSHPLPALLAHGVPVALCNDDPAILGQEHAGMSHDCFQVLQAIESLGLDGLGALIENSIRYAAFEDMDPKTWTEDVKAGAFGSSIKAKRMKEWHKAWERFCQWVVIEYGADVDLDPDE